MSGVTGNTDGVISFLTVASLEEVYSDLNHKIKPDNKHVTETTTLSLTKVLLLSKSWAVLWSVETLGLALKMLNESGVTC